MHISNCDFSLLLTGREKESENMVKTIAQALIEKGEELGMAKGIKLGKLRAKRDTLIIILRERFKVPQEDIEDIAEKVRSIDQIEELDELIDRAIVAKTFEDVGIRKK